jgi:hypothetical protein
VFTVEKPRKGEFSQPAQFTVRLDFYNYRLESHASASQGLNEYLESIATLMSPEATLMKGFQSGKLSNL